MAAKNRKRNNAGFAFPLPAAIFLALTATLLLSYIWLDTQTQAFGARIKTLEKELAEANKLCAHELSKWEKLKSPASIEQALARNRLVMVTPDAHNVVRMTSRRAPNDVGYLAHLANSSGNMMND